MIYTLTLNPAIDYVMHPLTLDMGFTNRSSVEEFHVGGNGLNISGILNELHVPNIAMGIVGGFTGEYVVDDLQERGITCNFVRLDRGLTRINVKLNGIVMTMVNGIGPKVPQNKVDELFDRLELLKEGDTLVLTGSIPSTLPDTIYETIMHRLHGRGIRFVVDAPGQELIKALPSKPFLIKPNNHEVGRLFNVRPETPIEVMPYARLLHNQGAANVIVSCGGHGSALIDENGDEHIALTPKIRLVNATGAGDSMVAGFLAKIDEGADYDTALRYASCCGSATAASKALAKRSQIEKLFVRLNETMDDLEPNGFPKGSGKTRTKPAQVDQPAQGGGIGGAPKAEDEEPAPEKAEKAEKKTDKKK